MSDQQPDGAVNPVTPESPSNGQNGVESAPDFEWRNPQEIKKWAMQTRKTHQELMQLRDEIQGLKTNVQKPAEPPKTPDPLDEVANLRAELQAMKESKRFNDVVGEVAPKLNRRQKDALEQLASVQRPDDLAGWIEEQSSLFAAVESAEMPKAIKKPVAQKPVDTGAAKADPKVGIPDGFFSLTPDMHRSLTDDELLQRYQAEIRSLGGGNPFARKSR